MGFKLNLGMEPGAGVVLSPLTGQAKPESFLDGAPGQRDGREEE
jgi:hypothetical protein